MVFSCMCVFVCAFQRLNTKSNFRDSGKKRDTFCEGALIAVTCSKEDPKRERCLCERCFADKQLLWTRYIVRRMQQKNTFFLSLKRIVRRESFMLSVHFETFENTVAISCVTVVYRSLCCRFISFFRTKNDKRGLGRIYYWKYVGFWKEKNKIFVCICARSMHRIDIPDLLHVTVLIDRENFLSKYFQQITSTVLLFNFRLSSTCT